MAGVVREKIEKAAIAEIKNCLCGGADMIDLHMSCLEGVNDQMLKNIIGSSKLPVLALNYNVTYDWQEPGYTEAQREELFLKAVDCGAAGSLSRIVNPILGGHMIFCVDRFRSSSTMEQLDLRTTRVAVDSIKKLM